MASGLQPGTGTNPNSGGPAKDPRSAVGSGFQPSTHKEQRAVAVESGLIPRTKDPRAAAAAMESGIQQRTKDPRAPSPGSGLQPGTKDPRSALGSGLQPGTGKDPRAVIKDPRTSSTDRVAVPPESSRFMRRAMIGSTVLLIGLVLANVIYSAVTAQKEAAEAVRKEDATVENNEILIKLNAMQNSINQLQTTVNQQDMTIKQLRSELQGSKSSVDSVRSLYLQAQSKGLSHDAK
jgi:hypothetical protein